MNLRSVAEAEEESGFCSLWGIQCCFSDPHSKAVRAGAAVWAGPGARSLCRVSGYSFIRHLLVEPYFS